MKLRQGVEPGGRVTYPESYRSMWLGVTLMEKLNVCENPIPKGARRDETTLSTFLLMAFLS